MPEDELCQQLDGYSCLFMDDPQKTYPYAMFSSEWQAYVLKMSLPSAIGPIKFETWRIGYQGRL